jgi:putative SOS response-associated peptidase YedK
VRPLHRQDDWAALDRPPHNLPPNYNVCPTDPIDVVTQQDGKRDFVRMRWGLVPQ